jgi:hypothetical protein
MRQLWRTALWGLAATAALATAGYATSTAIGQDRIAIAAAQAREMIHPTGKKPPRPMDADEGRKLAEAVRSLADERERLQSRLASLEGRVDDITGSVERVEKAVAAPPPRPVSEKPATPPEDLTSSIAAPNAEAQSERPGPARAEFGVDLGSANSLDGLRTLWSNTRQRHAAPLDGLRPIVQLRERPRPAPLELRLVAGPVVNAAAAARLCATLVASGALCQPAVFDGQRLAVR